MKKGWEVKKLGEVLSIERGGSPRPIEKYITNSPDGINWIKISDATSSEKYIYETKEKITRDGLRKTRVVNEGDFILSNSMSFGRPYIMKTTGCIHDGWLVLKQNGNKLFETEFLYYLLSSPYVFEQFNSLAAGSTVRNLNIALVSSVKVPIPSLAEQSTIVTILEEAFAGIAKAKANAEQNLKNVKELFESYLQNVFEKKGEGWKEKTLGDVCSLYQGIAINAKTKHALVEKSELPLLRIKDLRENTVEQYVDPNNFPKNALVNESDIIYTRTGNSLGLVFRGRKGVLHNNSFKIVPNNELDKDFLFIWLQNPLFKSKIFSLASKAAQPDITHAIFKIQEIAIPPLKEQKTIVLKLNALSEETKRLEAIYQQKLNNLEELKKSLLQKAFSGELKNTKELA